MKLQIIIHTLARANNSEITIDRSVLIYDKIWLKIGKCLDVFNSLTRNSRSTPYH